MSGETVLAAFTGAGAELSVRIASHIGGRVFLPRKHLIDGAEPMECGVGEWAAEWFGRAGAMIFVCACGIAVRAIAPHIRDKTRDPAVIVSDERGQFVIPILSGHIGGANALARRIADITGGVAAVTTATDVNGIIAADEWAVRNNCAIENPRMIKAVSSAVLAGESVGVAVTEQLQPSPWPATLWLRPRVLVLGVGCRRGVDPIAMAEAAADFLDGAGVSPLSLRAVASIDIKADEPAIISLAERFGVPFATFGASELNAIEGNYFSSSERVMQEVGVGCVCERAAAAASGGGVLLRSKTKYSGITFALARTPRGFRGRS